MQIFSVLLNCCRTYKAESHYTDQCLRHSCVSELSCVLQWGDHSVLLAAMLFCSLSSHYCPCTASFNFICSPSYPLSLVRIPALCVGFFPLGFLPPCAFVRFPSCLLYVHVYYNHMSSYSVSFSRRPRQALVLLYMPKPSDNFALFFVKLQLVEVDPTHPRAISESRNIPVPYHGLYCSISTALYARAPPNIPQLIYHCNWDTLSLILPFPPF